jgi:hypothetical protein
MSVECHHAGIVLPNNARVESGGRIVSGDDRCGNCGGVPYYPHKVSPNNIENKIKSVYFSYCGNPLHCTVWKMGLPALCFSATVR